MNSIMYLRLLESLQCALTKVYFSYYPKYEIIEENSHLTKRGMRSNESKNTGLNNKLYSVYLCKFILSNYTDCKQFDLCAIKTS